MFAAKSITFGLESSGVSRRGRMVPMIRAGRHQLTQIGRRMRALDAGLAEHGGAGERHYPGAGEPHTSGFCVAGECGPRNR